MQIHYCVVAVWHILSPNTCMYHICFLILGYMCKQPRIKKQIWSVYIAEAISVSHGSSE